MYNKDSDSLNAGAPDIRLSGNQQMASYGFDEAMAESHQAYDDARQKGLIPFDMEFEEFLELMQDSKRAPQQDSGIMAAAPGTYTQNRKRQMAAGGGIAGLEKRQGYFLGDLVDKIKDDLIPNELKENPALTAALIGGGINQFGLPDFLVPDFIAEGSNVGQNWLGNLLGNINPNLSDMVIGDTAEEKAAALSQPSGYFGSDTTTGRNKFLEAMGVIPSTPSSGLVNYALQQLQGGGGGGGGGLTGMFSSALSPYLGEGEGRRVNPLYPIGIGAAVGKYVSGLPKDELPMDTTSIDPAAIAAAARGTDAEGAAAGLRFLPEQVTRAAEGGRIGAQEGGLMNLGGMEKDYREEGGFVPIGGKEKADDVPARLSKNEFVFTADAVRGAGGGDIDKGAAIMENLMNNLEGARGMFANAQKLKNRII